MLYWLPIDVDAYRAAAALAGCSMNSSRETGATNNARLASEAS